MRSNDWWHIVPIKKTHTNKKKETQTKKNGIKKNRAHHPLTQSLPTPVIVSSSLYFLLSIGNSLSSLLRVLSFLTMKMAFLRTPDHHKSRLSFSLEYLPPFSSHTWIWRHLFERSCGFRFGMGANGKQISTTNTVPSSLSTSSTPPSPYYTRLTNKASAYHPSSSIFSLLFFCSCWHFLATPHPHNAFRRSKPPEWFVSSPQDWVELFGVVLEPRRCAMGRGDVWRASEWENMGQSDCLCTIPTFHHNSCDPRLISSDISTSPS